MSTSTTLEQCAALWGSLPLARQQRVGTALSTLEDAIKSLQNHPNEQSAQAVSVAYSQLSAMVNVQEERGAAISQFLTREEREEKEKRALAIKRLSEAAAKLQF